MNADSKYYDEYYDYVLRDIEPSTKAKKAVFDIVRDLTDRRGLKQEFSAIDGDIQDEIVDKWIGFIQVSLKEMCDGLSEDCLEPGWTDVKFCSIRQGEGGKCKWCI